MRKFFIVFMLFTLLLTTGLMASRNSDDIVTATNALFNNYIQDVIGNKNDTTNGTTLMGRLKNVSVKASNNNAALISDGITNEKMLRTNMNRNSLIQSDGVTNEKMLRTNMNRLTQIQSDGVTNEKLSRTNINRTTIGQAQSLSNRGMNIRLEADTVIIKSDGITNEKLLRTNQNRITIGQAQSLSNRGMSIRIEANTAAVFDHIHTAMQVYPTLATGATVNATGTSWALSNNFTNVIVPATTITSDFDIHHVSIEAISANGVYELVLYDMTAAAEIGRVRITKNATQDGLMNVDVGTAVIPANAKIGARLASSGGSNETITISLHYQLE